MLLLKGGEVYAPESIGRADVLIANGRIVMIRPDIPQVNAYDVQVIDCTGLKLCPALVDQHMHITGGGGETGPASRLPEAPIADVALAGIGTVAGLLGADGVTRGVAGLLAKARALTAQGLSAFIYSGSYGLPTDTLTGKVINDLVYIPEVLGAGEVAISDARSAHPDRSILRALAWEVHMGGMIGGKAGVMHIHVGDGRAGLGPLNALVEDSEFPLDMFVPTHLNRNRALFEQAVSFGRRGGNVDLTAGEGGDPGYPVPDAIHMLLARGVQPDRISASSDAFGANAQSPDGRGHPESLFGDFADCVERLRMPLPLALRFFTENPSKRLKLYPMKGCLHAGSDGDIMALDAGETRMIRLILRGETAVENGTCLLRG